MLQSIVRSRFWSAELNPNLFQLLDIPRLDGELQNQKLYIYISLDVTGALNQNKLNFLDY